MTPASLAAASVVPLIGYARPFMEPMPLWNHWPWLILPLAVAVAVVYKSIKCRHMRQVPKEAAVLTLWIVVGMAAAAGVLAAVVRLVERIQS